MEFVELEMAIAQLMAHILPQRKTKTIPLAQALNEHLAQNIYAPINVPAFNRSGMDGYAVKASQTKGACKKNPVKLKVLTELLAGEYQSAKIIHQGVVRVMTGAHVPDGFDAVIRQEDTDYGLAEVEIYREVFPHVNYGKIGEDLKQDQLVMVKFTRLTPVHLGILASLGIAEVKVLQPMRVGVMSTGNELVDLGLPLKPGSIYNSNRYLLIAKLQALKVEVVWVKQVQDEVSEACVCIEQGIDRVDLVLTTGGVSVGKKDILSDVITQLGAKRLFWKVKMRPGTPVLASLYQGKLILSLSGNPFAALTTFELLFRPLLAAFIQNEDYICPRKKAFLRSSFNKASQQRRFVRAFYEEGQVFLPTTEHASSVLSSLLECNCLIDIKAHTPKLEPGAEVEVVLLT